MGDFSIRFSEYQTGHPNYLILDWLSDKMCTFAHFTEVL